MAKNTANGLKACPFSWIQVSKPAGCFSPKEKIVTEPQPCMSTNCQLWNANQDDCGLLKK